MQGVKLIILECVSVNLSTMLHSCLKSISEPQASPILLQGKRNKMNTHKRNCSKYTEKGRTVTPIAEDIKRKHKEEDGGTTMT